MTITLNQDEIFFVLWVASSFSLFMFFLGSWKEWMEHRNQEPTFDFENDKN